MKAIGDCEDRGEHLNQPAPKQDTLNERLLQK